MAKPNDQDYSSDNQRWSKPNGVTANCQSKKVIRFSPCQEAQPYKSLIPEFDYEKLKIDTNAGKSSSKVMFIKKAFEVLLPGILPWMVLCAAYGSIIFLLDSWGLLSGISGSKTVSHAVFDLNLALTLVLIYRINLAHARYWRARKLWKAIVNVVSDIISGIWFYIEEQTPQDRVGKEKVMMLIPAFAIAMKLHLRQQPLNNEVYSLISPLYSQRLENTNHAPLDISFWISDYLQRQYELEHIDVFQLTYLQSCLDEMVGIFGTCERILESQIPWIYTMILKTLLVVYFLISPFGMVTELGWATGIVLAVLSFVYLSLSKIGAKIEQPFVYDEVNNLPLDLICDTIRHNVEDLIQQDSDSKTTIDLSIKTA